jgi:hypothetical protein
VIRILILMMSTACVIKITNPDPIPPEHYETAEDKEPEIIIGKEYEFRVIIEKDGDSVIVRERPPKRKPPPKLKRKPPPKKSKPKKEKKKEEEKKKFKKFKKKKWKKKKEDE